MIDKRLCADFLIYEHLDEINHVFMKILVGIRNILLVKMDDKYTKTNNGGAFFGQAE